MWRRKKLILMALLATVLLGAVAGGVAVAQSGSVESSQLSASTESTQPVDQSGALLARVAEIYQQNTGVAIDQEALKSAFAQAQKDMQIEALKDRLQKLVDEGTMTQAQADQYLQWWQSRPDVPGPLDGMGPGPMGRGMGPRGFCGGMELAE